MTQPKETFELFKKIASTCERWEMIPPDAVVVAGVSGGVDSMVMLAFFDVFRSQYDFDLFACHLNHMIRGKDADLDELLVESFCLERSIPYISVRTDIPKLADELGVSLEQAGREARRDTMVRLGMEYAGSPEHFRVAFAHHMDDRAESILMHIGRGSGLAGLVGIRYVDGVFIRPLLDLRLEEIESAAEILGLPWREDETNRSDAFLRNRVRRTLIPTWSDVLGYDPVPVLARLGDAAEGDEQALAQWTDATYRASLLPDGKLAVSSLANHPLAIVKRVLVRHFDESIAGDGRSRPSPKRTLGAAHLDQLVSGIGKSAGGEGREISFSLPGSVIARISDGRLFFIFPESED